MATEIRVPTLGESVTEATVAQWYKKPGESVAADEPLVELETDKVTVEVPAPAAGVLSEILAKDGETVEVGALLGQIGEGKGAAPAPKKEEPKKAEAKPEPKKEEPKKQEAKEPAKPADAEPSPAVRRVAAENDLDVSKVEGTGKGGRVTKADAEEAASGKAEAKPSTPVQAPAASKDESAREERVKMTRLRKTIASRLKEAQNTAAMLTTFNEVDLTNVMALRSQYKELFEKKHGVRVGFMGFFVKACIHALREIPAVNAEIDGTNSSTRITTISALRSAPTAVSSFRCCAMRRNCRSPISRRRSTISASAPATAISSLMNFRAAPSPSRMAASTVRSCRRRS